MHKLLTVAFLATALLLPACNKSAPKENHPAAPPAPSAEPAAKAGTAATAEAEKPKAAEDIPAPADVAAPPKDAQTTKDGLASKVLEKGTGTEHPTENAIVTVDYSGWTTDGKMFDSSVKRGRPATFPLNRVIPGWTEGVQLMVKGEQRRFWIPAALAYGDNPRPGAPKGMLVFDVKLIDFKEPPPPPPVPKDVAKPPKDAKKMKDGLYSKVLEKGTGKEHPTKDDLVTVDYTGWTTDGNMFDSSITRGKPATIPLSRVIPGWAEGVEQMVVGETRRLWIPEELAYKGRPGAPQGMLVFDIKLLNIQKMPQMPAGHPGAAPAAEPTDHPTAAPHDDTSDKGADKASDSTSDSAADGE
ncbi:MAG: FKBP-type peptidyl-prolyl cis-trans isomerase [Myxococcales bacterium]|nr:FKBP-type peptidyl-prolyl cis-trans isomerase [Myxococcales bacterium]